jgi:hypothetical protein
LTIVRNNAECRTKETEVCISDQWPDRQELVETAGFPLVCSLTFSIECSDGDHYHASRRHSGEGAER